MARTHPPCPILGLQLIEKNLTIYGRDSKVYDVLIVYVGGPVVSIYKFVVDDAVEHSTVL